MGHTNRIDDVNINHEDINDSPYFSNSIISIPLNVNDISVTNEIIKAKGMSRLRKLCNKNYKFNKILLRIFISYFWQTKTIRDISLCSNYGEYFGFLKANGAGKTIIFKFLSKEILSTYDNYISIIKK